MYYLYSLLTAPGVVLHELGHAIFCIFAGVKIHQIKLFRFGNPAGFVKHDEPDKFYQSLLISLGPLIVNSLVTLVCFARISSPYLTWQNLLVAWLGIAVGLHAIPSTGDTRTLVQTTNRRFWRNPLVALGYPVALALYVLNLLRRVHADAIYVAVLFWLGRFFLKG